MQMDQLLNGVIEVVSEVGDFIANAINSRHNIQTKSIHNYVTETDKSAEYMLVERLGALLPGSVFLTEEETVEQREGEFRWIIDPLDGTTNFIHGFYPVAVSVALEWESEIFIGVVYEIGQKEMFYAIKGKGAFLNGKRIKVSATDDFDKSLLATGFPFHKYEILDKYTDLLKELMLMTSGIRRLGSAATDLVYTATGRFDAFYEYGLNPWDVAAGALIVKEAGGIVSDFSGAENWLFGGEIIASNLHIYEQLLSLIKQKILGS